jgi:hypothetical protein
MDVERFRSFSILIFSKLAIRTALLADSSRAHSGLRVERGHPHAAAVATGPCLPRRTAHIEHGLDSRLSCRHSAARHRRAHGQGAQDRVPPNKPASKVLWALERKISKFLRKVHRENLFRFLKMIQSLNFF